MSLYDWISTYKRGKLPTKNKGETAKSGSLPVDDKAVEENDCEEDFAWDEPINDTVIDTDGDDGKSFSDPGKDKATLTAKAMLHFTANHPLFSTHGLKCLPSPLVPNFVGQTLPRCDQSDQEFYCTTMLTLFKPW